MGFLEGLDMAGPYIQTGLNYLIQKDAAKRQAKENMKLAQYQNEANAQFIQSQNEYNTPLNQIARYQQAGLNPALAYGTGNPGNQSSAQQAARVERTDYQTMANILPLLNQTRMQESQIQALDARTRREGVLTELNSLQARVVAANPLLNEGGFNAIIDALKSSAEIKASESKLVGQRADWMTSKPWRSHKDKDGNMVLDNTSGGWLLMEKQLDLLDQKYDLGTQDSRIKAEILNSKEFQNDLLEVQRKWMVDGQITPQHILQFIQILLMKALK